MSPSPEAVEHQATRQALAEATARAVLERWAQVDPERVSASWSYLLTEVMALVMAGQLTAARQSEAYMRTLLADAPPAATPIPEELAGVAPDGRPLESLLAMPIGATLGAIAAGAAVGAAMATGAGMLDMLVRTVVADTGRTADQVSMVVRPAATSYMRVVELPSCARCLILAGREYGVTEGFLRHPRCDCTMEPITKTHRPTPVMPEDVYAQMSPAARRRAFGEAGVKAIDDGADISRVVNARKAMTTVDAAGRKLQATYVGTGRKKKPKRPPRLMPAAIYDVAASREQAVEMLRQEGFIA